MATTTTSKYGTITVRKPTPQERLVMERVIRGGAASFGAAPIRPSAGMSVAKFKAFQAQKAAASRAAEVAKVKEFSSKAGELVEKADSDSAKATTAYKMVEAANTKLERLEREVNIARTTGMTVREQQLNREIKATRAEGKSAYLEGYAYSGSAKRKFDTATGYIESKRVEFEQQGIKVVSPEKVPTVPTRLEVVAPTPGVTARGIDIRATALPEEAGYVRRWRSPTEPYLSRERIEAAQRAELSKAAMLSAGLAIPIGGAAAYGAGGLAGLAGFGAELTTGYVASEVVSKEAPPILKAAFPGRSEEVYQISGEALGVAAFVGAAGATRVALKTVMPKLKPLKEFGAIEVVKKKGAKVKLPKKIKTPELKKFLAPLTEPRRPLTYPEQLFERGLKGRLPKQFKLKLEPLGKTYNLPPIKKLPSKIISPKAFILKELPKKTPELGKFLAPLAEARKPLTYPEQILKIGLKGKLPKQYAIKIPSPKGFPTRTITLQKFKPMKPLVFKPPVAIQKLSPPTTAGLFKVKQMPISTFTKEVEKIVAPTAPKVSLDIPGGYAALAKGLSRFIQPTKLAVRPPKLMTKPTIREPFEEFKAASLIVPKEMRAFAMAPKARFGTFVGMSPAQREISKEIERTVPEVAISLKAILKEAPKLKEVEKVAEKAIEYPIVKPVEIFRKAERIKEIEGIAERIMPVPKTILRMKIPTIPKIITEIYKLEKPKEPIRPKTPPPLLPKLKVRRREPGFKPADEFGFAVLGKRRGKWFPLTEKVLGKETAWKVGAKWAATSLGASFRLVKKAGKPIRLDIPTMPIGMFRKPIRKGKLLAESPIWIEKRRFRLDVPSEVGEIQAAKMSLNFLGKPIRTKERKTKKKRRKR